MTVRIGEVPSSAEGMTASGVLWSAGADMLRLDIPDVARLLVRRDEIVVAPAAGVACEEIGPFLRRTPAMALALLRGGLACNGAAVAGPTGAILIVGRSATGKSRLAAALIERGARLLADDAATVTLEAEGRVLAHPAHPEMALWPDAVDGMEAGWLRPAPRPPGFGAPLWTVEPQRFEDRPAPVRAIYRLRHDPLAERVGRREVKGLDRLRDGALPPCQPRIAAAMADPAALLRLHGALASQARFETVDLPRRTVRELDPLADAIAEEQGWTIGP